MEIQEEEENGVPVVKLQWRWRLWQVGGGFGDDLTRCSAGLKGEIITLQNNYVEIKLIKEFRFK